MNKSLLTILFISVLAVGFAVFFVFESRETAENGVVPMPTSTPRPGLAEMIHLDKPRPNQLVKSPLAVTGEARGYWFFEASFPVRVLDANNTELAVAPAQVQGDPVTGEVNWMTEDFVPFKAVLEFKKPAVEMGFLVLEKDNPSGLPEHAAEIKIPIRFDLENWPESPSASGGCKITGCSGQICAKEEVITTCEFKPEYTCYKTAKCERQSDGKCDWTPASELISCLRSTEAEID